MTQKLNLPKPVTIYGHYVVDDNLLYFETDDGSRFLVAGYKTMEESVIESVLMNLRIGSRHLLAKDPEELVKISVRMPYQTDSVEVTVPRRLANSDRDEIIDYLHSVRTQNHCSENNSGVTTKPEMVTIPKCLVGKSKDKIMAYLAADKCL